MFGGKECVFGVDDGLMFSSDIDEMFIVFGEIDDGRSCVSILSEGLVVCK